MCVCPASGGEGGEGVTNTNRRIHVHVSVARTPTLAQGHVIDPFLLCLEGEGRRGFSLCETRQEEGRAGGEVNRRAAHHGERLSEPERQSRTARA